MSAVKLLLDRTKTGMQTLKQQHAIVVLDETIYAKAQEIEWKNQQEYSSIVLRMGSFHIIRAFLAIIGKRFEGSG